MKIYHQEGSHSALSHLPPLEFEQKLTTLGRRRDKDEYDFSTGNLLL